MKQSQNLVQHADLESPQSRATEFSWTSRLQNVKLHAFNSKRYDFHENRPNEPKVMIDFPKFWKKYVGANLDQFSPRRTYSIALRNKNSPSLQATSDSKVGVLGALTLSGGVQGASSAGAAASRRSSGSIASLGEGSNPPEAFSAAS